VVSNAPDNAPWDQRLTEHLARESWEAANNPARRPWDPPFREQIKSPYYWFSVLAVGGAILIWSAARPGWMHALAAVLYLLGLLASVKARRDARAAWLGSRTPDEK
jgi:hypothetical protein